MADRSDGRLVKHFGRPYIWLLNERGRLELIAMDRVSEALRAVLDGLRPDRRLAPQQADPGVLG